LHQLYYNFDLCYFKMNCCQDINFLFKDEITCIEGTLWDNTGTYYGSEFAREEIGRLIDHMGQRAAQAQCQDFPLTNKAMFKNSGQRIYVLKVSNVFGTKGAITAFARVGWKPLTLQDQDGFLVNKDMFCLFDMYVAQSYQRQGNGKKIMDFVFRHERIQPFHLAVEQPSRALLSFFNKHYYLRDFSHQDLKFIVWKRFMDEIRPCSKSGIKYRPRIYTLTSTPARDYRGGPWPILTKQETLDKHPYVNWHTATAATPGENFELNTDDKHVYVTKRQAHVNADECKTRKRQHYTQAPRTEPDFKLSNIN